MAGCIRSWHFTVASLRPEETESKELECSERGEDRKIPKVGIPIGPVTEPLRDKRQLRHVGRRREGAEHDRREQRERQRERSKAKKIGHSRVNRTRVRLSGRR